MVGPRGGRHLPVVVAVGAHGAQARGLGAEAGVTLRPVGPAGGVALCARRVQAADPVLAAGPAAALAAWALHASLDWDWEMPALTLVALTLAAMLVARGDASAPAA